MVTQPMSHGLFLQPSWFEAVGNVHIPTFHNISPLWPSCKTINTWPWHFHELECQEVQPGAMDMGREAQPAVHLHFL